MEVELSSGLVAAIWEGEVAREMPLVLQVLLLPMCSCAERPEPGWYHAALSDGAHQIYGHLRLDETASAAVRAAPLGYGAVVRLLDFETRTNIEGLRSIDSEHVEVLHTSLKIGDPKTYRPGYLVKKHEKLDAQVVTSSSKQNFGVNPIGQGLKLLLIRGVVAMLQHPVMQVVGVSLLRSDPKSLLKYHLILSDGVHTQNATLHPCLNHLVEETHLRKGTIVRLLEFVCCNVRYRRAQFRSLTCRIIGIMFVASDYRDGLSRYLSAVTIGAVLLVFAARSVGYFLLSSWPSKDCIITVFQLKVLLIECELIGSPKACELCCIEKVYGLESESVEPYSGSVSNYAQPNNGPYFNCQGLNRYLTQGAVAAIMEGEMVVERQPVLQVVDFSLASHNGFSFYRILLSDGVHQVYVNLFPHLSHLVEGSCLRKGTRIRLLRFIRDTVDQDLNCRIAIAAELEVLQTECELIGNPTFYELGNKQSHSNSESLLPISGSFCKDQGGMEMQASLTWGAVAAIWEDAAVVVQPVLQVFDLLVWTEMDEPWLSPILLSDGTHLIRGGLSRYIISSFMFRDGRLHMGTVVRLLEFTCHNDRSERVIVVLKLEVLRTDCTMVGNPKQYPSGKLENKREELDPESVSSNAKLNCEAYSAGQRLKEFLTRRGMVTALQQPVMQVVDVSLLRSELKKFGRYHLVLSDTVYTQDATLAPGLNHLVENILLIKGSIIRLLEFICDTTKSPSMIIVIQLEVLQTVCELIGSPKAYELSLFEKPYVPEGKYGEPYPRSVANYTRPMNGPCPSGQGFKGHLTWGAVVAILEGQMIAERQPVMQVLGVSKDNLGRYLISLSDGVYWTRGFLISNQRHLVDNNCICKGTIVCLHKFFFDTFRNCRTIYFAQFEVLEKKWELIGSPAYKPVNKQKGSDAGHASYIPADAAGQSSGQSHPRYKGTPG